MKGTYRRARQTRVYWLIASFVLVVILIGCGNTPPLGNRAKPTPNPPSTPAQTATREPTPSPTAAPTPTPAPTPTEPPAPTPSPTPPPPAGACDPNPGVGPVSAGEVDRGETSRPQVALTFDAGGPVEPVPRLLATLAKYHLHVTFFLTGQWAQQNPDLVRQIQNAGHEIGNHTMNHPYLTHLSDPQVCTELNQAESSIAGLTGQTTRPSFRPPYGDRDSRVRQLAAHLGYRTIYWTIDTIDWDPNTTSQMIIDRVMNHLGNGAIILMHAGSSTEADTLEKLIPMIQQRGYQIVTVTGVLQ